MTVSRLTYLSICALLPMRKISGFSHRLCFILGDKARSFSKERSALSSSLHFSVYSFSPATPTPSVCAQLQLARWWLHCILQNERGNARQLHCLRSSRQVDCASKMASWGILMYLKNLWFHMAMIETQRLFEQCVCWKKIQGKNTKSAGNDWVPVALAIPPSIFSLTLFIVPVLFFVVCLIVVVVVVIIVLFCFGIFVFSQSETIINLCHQSNAPTSWYIGKVGLKISVQIG